MTQNLSIFVIATGPKSEPLGFGRDAEEAACHAGYGPIPLPTEEYWEVELHDNANDSFSAYACDQVCSFHLDRDAEVLPDVVTKLRKYIDHGMYATAIHYCMNHIRDRRWED